MTRYIRKPAPIEAFQWNRDLAKKDWPEWARLYRGTDSMGQLAPIGPGGIGGTLLIPSGANNMVAESSDWIVFEGEVTTNDEGERVAVGRVSVVPALIFDRDYEPEGGQPQEAAETTAETTSEPSAEAEQA